MSKTLNITGSHGAAGASRHTQLVKQTQRLVSQTFFGTMLKQMRDSPFKSNMMDGGSGGQAFSSLLDQHLADRMASGAGSKLVSAMVHRIEQPGSRRYGVKKAPEASKQQKSTQARMERMGLHTPRRTTTARTTQAGSIQQQDAQQERPHVPADLRA